MQCKTGACGCKMFAFVPGRPEDVGEFWFQRRRDFDPSTWRAKCRCKHTHEEHDPNGLRRCKFRGCSCAHFRIFIDDSLKLLSPTQDAVAALSTPASSAPLATSTTESTKLSLKPKTNADAMAYPSVRSELKFFGRSVRTCSGWMGTYCFR